MCLCLQLWASLMPQQCHLLIKVIKWASSLCSDWSETTVGTCVNLNKTYKLTLFFRTPIREIKDEYHHFTGFLYILARKYLSAESFLLAFGFKIRTPPNTLESFSWSFWARIPSQYLQSREPPGCKTFSAKSIKEKHIMMSFSWSISLKPLAFGAMSLRMTWAWLLGSSSRSLACVVGSVTSWLDRKWAPSRWGMFSRSMPTTVPRGSSGSRMKGKISNWETGNCYKIKTPF